MNLREFTPGFKSKRRTSILAQKTNIFFFNISLQYLGNKKCKINFKCILLHLHVNMTQSRLIYIYSRSVVVTLLVDV